MERKKIAVSELKDHPKNPNLHPKEQIEDIAKSIKEYGQYYPIIVDETNTILAGHGKRKALELLGEKMADCIVMSGLSEKQKLKLLLSDNKIQQFSFLDHAIEEDLIKEIDDTDIIGYNSEYLHDLIAPVEFDNMGMQPAVPVEEYAQGAREMNTPPAPAPAPADGAPVPTPAPVPTDELGQKTKADDDNPMVSFTAKHQIKCPHCGGIIEI